MAVVDSSLHEGIDMNQHNLEVTTNHRQAELPASAQCFDSLPNSAQIDLPCLKAITSKSRATIYRWIDQGILPKPRKIGTSRNLWTVGEIRQALSL